MNSKKLERNLKGSLGSSNTTRSIVIDDDGAHATNTKKFSSRCLIGNWPSEKLKEDVSLFMKNYPILKSHPAPSLEFLNLTFVSSGVDKSNRTELDEQQKKIPEFD